MTVISIKDSTDNKIIKESNIKRDFKSVLNDIKIMDKRISEASRKIEEKRILSHEYSKNIITNAATCTLRKVLTKK